MEGATGETKALAKIAVAASTDTTTLPNAAGSKPSTSVDQTPTQRTKRKKRTPPASKGPRTPTTPAFTSKKQNAKSLRKVQKTAPKEDLDTTTIARAANLFKNNNQINNRHGEQHDVAVPE